MLGASLGLAIGEESGDGSTGTGAGAYDNADDGGLKHQPLKLEHVHPAVGLLHLDLRRLAETKNLLFRLTKEFADSKQTNESRDEVDTADQNV